MQHYLLALGVVLVCGGIVLLVSRLRFVRGATIFSATVSGIRRRHYLRDDDGGPSKHIEVEYIDGRGERCRRVIDNSLLAYVYRPGQPIELAVAGDRVMVNSRLNLLTGPVSLVAIGTATLYGCLPLP